MTRTTPTARALREQPDLDQLKRQAKELLAAFVAAEPAAVHEVNAHYRAADAATFALHDAQLVLARAYGFDSWPKLKAYVDGVTVKHLAEAVRAGDLRRVRAMLNARPELVNMELSGSDEHRAIHYAVLGRSPEMVRLLMDLGADARKGIYPHRDATTALTIATERGHDDIVAIIQEIEQRRETIRVDPASADSEAADAGPEQQPSAMETRARAAVARGDTGWLRARHEEGGFANPVNWKSGGLITVAVEHDRPDMLALLLDFGFDPNEPVRSGDGNDAAHSQGFALWHCAAHGKQAMAETLLQRGANPNAHVCSSGSAVYAAYSHRQWAMVDVLRRHGGVAGADTAALYRQTDIAKALLDDEARGPLPEGTVSPGRTVAEDLLDYGASGGADEIVRLALERIRWERSDPRWFWMLGRSLDFWNHIPWLYASNPALDRGTYLKCFEHVLARCDPNVLGRFGRTVLHEVAALGDHVMPHEAAAFMTALLDAGARLDVRDDLLMSTPLGWACRWGRVGQVKLLLARGADPVEADAEPWATPLAWAEKMGHKAVIDALRE